MRSSNKDTPRLWDAMSKSSNQLGLAAVTLIGWLYASDGQITMQERDNLRAMAMANDNATSLDTIIDIAEDSNPIDLQLAAEIAQRNLTGAQRGLFLNLAIEAALCDGFLSVGENHVLRFLADLVRYSPAAFDKLFRERTGYPFPSPGDPSSASWWRAHSEESAEAPSTQAPASDRAKALAILGLRTDASVSQIKTAFRSLAKKHHPDRYQHLGAAAVDEAKRRSQRIIEAYKKVI